MYWIISRWKSHACPSGRPYTVSGPYESAVQARSNAEHFIENEFIDTVRIVQEKMEIVCKDQLTAR